MGQGIFQAVEGQGRGETAKEREMRLMREEAARQADLERRLAEEQARLEAEAAEKARSQEFREELRDMTDEERKAREEAYLESIGSPVTAPTLGVVDPVAVKKKEQMAALKQQEEVVRLKEEVGSFDMRLPVFALVAVLGLIMVFSVVQGD